MQGDTSMAVGFPVTKDGVNNNVGVCARALYNAFATIDQFKAWLDTQAVSDLQALGFTEGEANVVKSIAADLDHLRAVWEGTETRSPAYDYRTFAKQAIGPGLT